MKAILLVGICAFICTLASSQSQGPLSGSTFSTVSIPGSNSTWANTSNSVISDDAYSTFGNLTGGTGSFTDYLVVSNFNFNIPAGTVISGIEVEVEDSDPNLRTSEYSVRILNGGIIGTTEKATGAAYPVTDAYRTYGGNTDLWGDVWLPKDINNVSFGIAIAAQRNAAGGVTAGEIDDIRITVYFAFTTLPVKLISFSAVKGQNVVHLIWTTAEETNMAHYEVERSADGRNFTSTGNISSRNLPGNNQYTKDDNAPLNGKSWYRLKMVSLSGAVNYSDIIAVQFKKDETLQLYPNPYSAAQTLHVTNPDKEQLKIQFFNHAGKNVSSITTSNSDVLINKPILEKEMLYFRITNSYNEIVGTGKLILK